MEEVGERVAQRRQVDADEDHLGACRCLAPLAVDGLDVQLQLRHKRRLSRARRPTQQQRLPLRVVEEGIGHLLEQVKGRISIALDEVAIGSRLDALDRDVNLRAQRAIPFQHLLAALGDHLEHRSADEPLEVGVHRAHTLLQRVELQVDRL